MANPTPEQQKFINNELKLMAQQDKQLGKAQSRDDQKTIAALGRDSQRYSQLAAKYNPVQAQDMTGLSNSARDRILANQARTNAVGSAQASGLAKEIADQGKAATDFMRVMRSSNPARHREYVQYLHNIRPSLLEEKQASDLRNDLAEKEFGLSEEQFEWDKRKDKAAHRATIAENNRKAAADRVKAKGGGPKDSARTGAFESLYRYEPIKRRVVTDKKDAFGNPTGEQTVKWVDTGKKRLAGPSANAWALGYTELRNAGFDPKKAAKYSLDFVNRWASETGGRTYDLVGATAQQIYEQLRADGISESSARNFVLPIFQGLNMKNGVVS